MMPHPGQRTMALLSPMLPLHAYLVRYQKLHGWARPNHGEIHPEQARQAWEFGGDVFEREDLPVAEQCQLGLAASGGDYKLGRNEPLLQFWHRLWDSID